MALAVTSVVAAVSVIGAPSATAATEFGDNCVAKSVVKDFTSLFEISAPDNPLPVAAPSAGVITRWKTSIPPTSGSFPASLKVLRLSGATALVVGESPAIVTSGTNTVETRIPVQAGDHLGISATGFGAYYCLGSEGDRIGLIEDALPVGAGVPFIEDEEKVRVPAAAVLEPDADGDGYGDETQDQCPQSTGFQAACPVVVLDSTPLLKKGKVVVLVAASTSTKVTVSGSAKLPKGASSSAQAKLAKVAKPVTAGKITRFALKFPASLKFAVAGLPRQVDRPEPEGNGPRGNRRNRQGRIETEAEGPGLGRSADLESAEALRLLLAHLDQVDAGATGAIAAEHQHRLDRSRRPLEYRFDLSIVTVSDPSGDRAGLGLPPGGVAEEDSLDATVDDRPPVDLTCLSMIGCEAQEPSVGVEERRDEGYAAARNETAIGFGQEEAGMRKRLAVLGTALVAALGVIGVPSASAAVEFGDNCIANDDLETPFTLFEISNPANPLPTAAPSQGVITKWKSSLIATPGSLPLRFQALHPTGPGQVQVVGESTQNVTGGLNVFDTRIPVNAGDRIAIGAVIEEANLICKSEGNPSFIGGFIGNPGLGGKAPTIEAPAEFRLPLAALLEPDADNDGFGDETQDQCPQSATTQAACPVVTIDCPLAERKGCRHGVGRRQLYGAGLRNRKREAREGQTGEPESPDEIAHPGPDRKVQAEIPGEPEEPAEGTRAETVTAAEDRRQGHQRHGCDQQRQPEGEAEGMTMRISLGLTVTAALAASLLVPSGAAAATEFGDNCTANKSTSGTVVTYFEIASPGPLPAAAPIAGVITKWRVNVVPAPFSLPHTLKVLRITGPGTALTVGEAAGSVSGGGSSFDARIPVQAGDHLGIYGSLPIGTLYCEAPSETITIGGFVGSGAGIGGATPFTPAGVPIRIPVSAVIEPDADGDGYGDETQDKCPQSATTQGVCPVLVLDSFALPKKGKVVVLVSASTATQVTVSGSAKLPKAPKKATSSAQAKLAKLTRPVTPGKLNRFTLNFPAPLKSAVAALPEGKSITLKLQATAADVTGKAAKDTANLKLKG